MIRLFGWLFASAIFVGLSILAAVFLTAVVSYARARGAEPTYAWVEIEGKGGDEIALYRGGYQIGGWRISEQAYYPRLAPGVWGKLCPPPVGVPECYRADGRRRGPGAVTNYGVDLEEHDQAPRGWSINGRHVSADEARQVLVIGTGSAVSAAIAGVPAIPNDAALPYILWVGDDATGQRIKADAGDKARVQIAQPGSWQTADRDGKPIYGPGIWFVRPSDNKCVGHEATYAGAAQLAEGLRRCAPTWQPDAVPDLSTPTLPSMDIPAQAALPGALVGGGLLTSAGLLLSRRLRRPKA